MRSAFLDEAHPEAISHTVREILVQRGALISEHRHSRVRFHGYKPQAMSWPRAGYVGIYQHLGEQEAEVKLILRARIPWRILWAVCIVNILLLLFCIFSGAAPTTWTVLAILGGLALIGASVLYTGTLKSVRAEERDLMTAFEHALGAMPDTQLETDEERERARLEAELEGEITRRRIEAARPPKEKGKRFSLRPGKKDPSSASDGAPPSADERRAEILRRKAELEARKAAQEGEREGDPPRS